MATGSSLLLADDSITIQKVINLTFADEGMNVTTVGNGDLALAKIEELSPDIVMLDVHMPGLNGYEICERLKQSEKFRDIPVILLVGSFEPFDEDEARRVGADDYLTKPFQSIRQLINKVGSLLHDRPTRALDATAVPVPDGDDSVVEYEVAPGQELAGTRNAVGIPSGVTARSEPGREEPETWSGQRSEFDEDAGLDDELIQARPITGDVVNQETFTGGSRATRPLSALEVDELAYVSSTGIADGQSSLAGTHHVPVAEPADDSVLDLGDIDGPALNVVAEEVLDLGETEPVPVEPAVYARNDQPDEIETAAVNAEVPMVAPEPVEPTPSAETSWAEPAPSAAASWAEPAPPVETGWAEPSPPAETSWAEATTPVETSWVEPTPIVEHAAPAAEPVAAAVQSGGPLTAADIDAIARRVVEQLSDQAVRDIAWEVVPQLAELLIKRKLEENQ